MSDSSSANSKSASCSAAYESVAVESLVLSDRASGIGRVVMVNGQTGLIVNYTKTDAGPGTVMVWTSSRAMPLQGTYPVIPVTDPVRIAATMSAAIAHFADRITRLARAHLDHGDVMSQVRNHAITSHLTGHLQRPGLDEFCRQFHMDTRRRTAAPPSASGSGVKDSSTADDAAAHLKQDRPQLCD